MQTYRDTLESHWYPDQRDLGTTLSECAKLPDLIINCGKPTGTPANNWDDTFSRKLCHEVSTAESTSEDIVKRLQLYETSHGDTGTKEDDGSPNSAERSHNRAKRAWTGLRGASTAKIREKIQAARTNDGVTLPIMLSKAADAGDPVTERLLSFLYKEGE